MDSLTTSSAAANATSSYGTISAAPPEAAGMHVANAPVRSSSPPSDAAAVPPSTPAATYRATYPPTTTGYNKLITLNQSPPVAAPPPPLLSESGEQGRARISSWQDMFRSATFSQPANASDAIGRMRRNLVYFRLNYIITAVEFLLLAIVYHPFPLLACSILAYIWLCFYKKGPFVVVGRTFDESLLVQITACTFAALLFTSLRWRVVRSLAVSAAFVGIHSAFWSGGGLFLTEREAARDGLVNPTAARAAQVL